MFDQKNYKKTFRRRIARRAVKIDMTILESIKDSLKTIKMYLISLES